MVEPIDLAVTSEPRLARRIIAIIATLALCGVAIGAYSVVLSAANADLLGTLVYSFTAIILGYMSVQIAPEIFKRS